MSPQIPGMPMPLPPTDPGQGEHGSQPWYSRADDYLWAEQVTVAIAVADGLGWTHAAAHLRHYLNNTGEDLTLDPDQIMNDDPTLKEKADKVVNDYVRYLASIPSNYGVTIPFQVPWEADHTFSQSSQADWFFVLDRFMSPLAVLPQSKSPRPTVRSPAYSPTSKFICSTDTTGTAIRSSRREKGSLSVR